MATKKKVAKPKPKKVRALDIERPPKPPKNP